MEKNNGEKRRKMAPYTSSIVLQVSGSPWFPKLTFEDEIYNFNFHAPTSDHAQVFSPPPQKKQKKIKV